MLREFRDPLEREDEAKRLLTEAGFGPAKSASTIPKITVRRPWRLPICGRRLALRQGFFATDATSYYAFLHEKPPFDVARSGWFADYPDAQNFLFLAQSDNQALNVASFNDARGSNGSLVRPAPRRFCTKPKRCSLTSSPILCSSLSSPAISFRQSSRAGSPMCAPFRTLYFDCAVN
jgi:hypothetical protein